MTINDLVTQYVAFRRTLGRSASLPERPFDPSAALSARERPWVGFGSSR